jgi:hypothetical protein
MAIAATVQHVGSLSGCPATPTTTFPTLQEIANTSFSRTYSQRIADTLSVVGATDLAPFSVPFGSITKARMVYLRASQTIKIKVTTLLAVDQVLPLSDMFLLHNPNEGDQITAIKVVGTADIECVLAGDS